MMKGLPCSGKTEWATKWANQKANRLRLSWSDILNSMGGRYSRERRPIAFDGMLRMMCVALRHGKDVVIDEWHHPHKGNAMQGKDRVAHDEDHRRRV